MKIQEAKKTYEMFDEFIENCIINKNSLLTDAVNVFTMENINEVIRIFVDNPDYNSDTFDNKVQRQFKDSSIEVRTVFAHCYYLWYMALYDLSNEAKKKYAESLFENEIKLNDRCFIDKGIGKGGTYHFQNKYDSVVFDIRLVKYLLAKEPKTIEAAKQMIENFCLYCRDGIECEGVAEYLPEDERKRHTMCNILLHLCDDEKYERILSNTYRQDVCKAFSSLIDSEDQSKTIDEKLVIIRKKLKESGIKDTDFYSKEVIKFWNPTYNDKSYSEYQALKYKKSIVLYGPPGTSKTYSAKEIAKSFILQRSIEIDKDNVRKVVNGDINIDNHIHHLQLHSNYTYEDFIAGMQLENGNTIAKKGYFLKLCETINTDSMPHVLILDEINRIDLSRLFGELFSAIENRNTPIDLSIGDFKIKVPDNLYIIGTMNEIDFSLEQIDFALRRRFVWFFYGYDDEKLKSIIDYKIEQYNDLKISSRDIDRYIYNVSMLNKKIADIEELGKEYEVGHAFFGEVVDIAKEFIGRPGYINKVSLFKGDGPCSILWNISIKPIVEAFLGNVDKDYAKETLKSLEEIFLNEGK